MYNITNIHNPEITLDTVMEFCRNLGNDNFAEPENELPANHETTTDEQKELFIATLAHDLKNPLQAQLSGLKMLSCGSFGSVTKDQKEILSLIIESGEFMQNMLSTLLTTYKYENGAVRLNIKKFNFNRLIKKCIKEYSLLAKDKHLQIEFKPKLKKHEVYADETQIRRVISNLLINSINYSFKNKKIIIETENTEQKAIFKITNFSPTIPEEIQATMFNKYTTGLCFNKHIGTGLGLYFCRKTTEAHGGSIHLVAEKEKNSFIFELPQGGGGK